MTGGIDCSGSGVDAASRIVAHYLRDPASSWSIGEIGALAEFHQHGATRWPDAGSVVTSGGSMRIELPPGTVLRAYETPSANPALWNHGVVFCLPHGEARMGGRIRVTEIGPDAAALLESRRDQILLSRLARIEVDNPIPGPTDASPDGPHTHLLPKLMRQHRVVDANIPLPSAAPPCLTLHLSHPARDREGRQRAVFDTGLFAAWQAVLERFGDPLYLAAKRGDATADTRLAQLARLIGARQNRICGTAAAGGPRRPQS